MGIAGSINLEAKDNILSELRRLLDFLQGRSQRDIKGASILIIVDHFTRSYCVKMIDLSTIRIYDTAEERDEGLIVGVRNLIRFIGQLG